MLAATSAAVRGAILGRTVGHEPVFWDPAYRKAHPDFFRTPRTGDTDYAPDDDGVMRFYPAPGSLAAAAIDPSSGPAAAGPELPRRSSRSANEDGPAADGGLLRWRGTLEQIRARGVPVVPAGAFIEAGLPIVDRLSQKVPDFSPEGFGPALAAEPRLTGGVFDLVRGRTVFVGANASGTFDLKVLPVGKLEPGVLLHWTAWTDLVAHDFIFGVPRWVSLLVAALVAGLVVLLAGRWPGLTVPAVAALGFVALLFPAAYLGLSSGWFFPPATPAAAALVTLLGVAAESFWTERARKREIQAMFGAYVDPKVVERLVRDPDSIHLQGEKGEATVFFSDLAGFTDLSEKLKDRPELMVEIVNSYLEQTSDCLQNHGAYVDKFIGDAVMGVFGVPQPLPNHALAACRAALAAQKAFEGINARYGPIVGVHLAMRIGLNTGELIAGNVGSSRKRNYTVMGDTVNLASRLEAANKAFGTYILIGEETARAVQGVLVTRPLARLRVKGKGEAVEVHTVLGLPEDLSAVQTEFLAAYRAGYDAYVNRRFAEAVPTLDRAEALLPGDLTTNRLREECARYSLTPPPADWEPILKLESK